MKSGIFGGSFNPIHCGHIALAEAFLRQCGLDEVLFVVSPQNPFKVDEKLLNDDLRLDMTRKALQAYPHFHVSDVEFSLPKPSFTWRTLDALSRLRPQSELTLLIGGDNWQAFDRWGRHDYILSHYRIAVYPRLGSTVDVREMPSSVSIIDAPLLEVSSTEIRKRVKVGLSISGLVPEEIEADVLRLYK